MFSLNITLSKREKTSHASCEKHNSKIEETRTVSISIYSAVLYLFVGYENIVARPKGKKAVTCCFPRPVSNQPLNHLNHQIEEFDWLFFCEEIISIFEKVSL